ncbi:hypothetical protein [Amygdalobacter nucleatus]|uniref:hypothetical protein n=1 Tax=Amygdalobacter nucleatus TaxID=3029274 RepID=UPI00279F447A|nr:hypothetical protein [Amygdalobacter nucleatus]WEG37250.1 hypothetical protein PYS63_02060 [Amygdalobacter nucleatus]
MFYAGIDVAMDKHGCVILDANGKCSIEVFTFIRLICQAPRGAYFVMQLSRFFYPICISAFSCFFFLTFNS